MKSLSEYTKILRDTATNLNLHGESVEMVVQMLANALYISEVEHIAYSQEASIERATQENSKIQHCVNQMYSVFRGSNPRIILNIKASKLFTFKPHQEIIKSNNYKVYFLGYYKETGNTGTINYSDLTVYPDSTVTIVGLLAKNIVTKSWKSTYNNPYYYTIPETDLSGDLYLDISGVRTEVTRIFSDHLKNDLPFDLTLPGYGMRLYYPESLQNVTNTEYSINIYEYMSLDEIQDSELKAVKMVGSTLTPFNTSTLKGLGAEETYPGVIFIPETERDAIDTIHHKANKARYSGTYLATNSDLSWLLQEYYPSKIRRLGVTYKFNSPKSTSLNTKSTTKTITLKSGTFLRFEDIKDSLGDWVYKDQGFLPKGEIKFQYKRSKEPTGTNSSYEILPSASVIPVRASYTSLVDTGTKNYLTPTISDITIRVLKNTSGQVKLLTTKKELEEEGILISYLFPEIMSKPQELDDTLKIQNLEEKVRTTSDKPLEIFLISSKTQEIVDREIIPFTYIPVTLGKVEIKGNPEEPEKVTESYITVTEEGPGDYYVLDLQEDTIYLKTNDSGEIIETSETSATLFYNGKTVSGATYSIIPSSDIEASINSETGEITITKMADGVLSSGFIVKARYNGMNFQNYLTCRKTISNYDSSTSLVTASFYSNLSTVYPILTLTGQSNYNKAVIEIPSGKYKSLSLKLSGEMSFINVEYTYSWEVLENIIPEGTETTPTLNLYYIPYSSSNTLNKEEITKFIESNKSYYITQDINIYEGKPVVAKFDISLNLYKNTSLDDTILDILQRYSYLFGVDFKKDGETVEEIKALITKISEVKTIESMNISYFNPISREVISQEDIENSDTPIYYIIEYVISSIVRE